MRRARGGPRYRTGRPYATRTIEVELRAIGAPAGSITDEELTDAIERAIKGAPVYALNEDRTCYYRFELERVNAVVRK